MSESVTNKRSDPESMSAFMEKPLIEAVTRPFEVFVVASTVSWCPNSSSSSQVFRSRAAVIERGVFFEGVRCCFDKQTEATFLSN